MDSDDEGVDMGIESENEESLEYEAATLESLRRKELIVQNGDGTLRCPLSPSRKKQSYAYKDLLQHATAVSIGKRGPEAVGQHSALKTFLESDLSSLAEVAPERTSKMQEEQPRRNVTEDMLVCPWSVVIYNIDNSQRDKGIQIGFGKSELKGYFVDFKPEKVHVFWGPEGHLGMCALHFGRDLSGFKDAQALEKSFLVKSHSLRDYERCSALGKLGNDLYGWLAREEDFTGRPGRQGTEIGKYLRTYGNLKDIGMIGAEIQKKHDLQVKQLAETVFEKNKEFLQLRTEMEVIRRRAEADRLQQEQAHKLELEAVRSKAEKSENEYNQASLESNRALKEREAQLVQRTKDLREKEALLKSAEDKTQLQSQMQETNQQRDLITARQGLLKQKQVDKVKLAQKHEEETKRLHQQAHNAALQLARKQNKEMEKQQINDLLETENMLHRLTVSDGTGHEGMKDNENEIKKIAELEDKLEELENDLELTQDFVTSLTVKERESTDEIADARKMAAQIMQKVNKGQSKRLIGEALKKRSELGKMKQSQPSVGVKMAGSIDESPWSRACEAKDKNADDPVMKMTSELSRWEDILRNPLFQPVKMVQIGIDKWENQFDPDNEELSSLRRAFGEEVYNSVTSAYMEIETYNASGRYPIAVPWVFEESRQATLKEVIAHLGLVVEALVANTTPRKKARS